jgi:xanthine dehydrogenase accessory factor
MGMKAVYDEAANLARQNREFVLATVVNTKGSTPQKPGAVLLVRGDGSTVGTLGGGCVEGDIWFAAKEALRERTGPLFKNYYLNEDIAARDGLVCGGTMYFYIEPFAQSSDVSDLACEIDAAFEGGPSLAVATVVNGKTLETGARMVVREGGAVEGTLGDAKADAQALEEAAAVTPMGKASHVRAEAGDELFIAGYTSPATVVLVGGGHVNLQVAKIAQHLGFRIMVTDDRPEFANRERFPMAEATSVASYDKGLEAFHITPNTAIIVGSRGHHFDDLALEAAVRTSASYVGLLGSKRKTIMIYEALMKRGIAVERLKQVHSPMGLDLGGRSPEEIALSVMSEIVAFRYGHDGSAMKLADAQIDKIAVKVRGARAKAPGH